MTGAPGARAATVVRLATVSLCIGLAILVVRDQSARAPAGHPLAGLAALWSGHPAVRDRAVIAASAAAASGGAPMGAEGRDAARALLARAPLSPTPLLVAGAEAAIAGNSALAERRFRAARLRDPRAPAPRLLLADTYLRRGEVRAGLAEMLALSRIAPRAAAPIGPALAAYARTPGAVANLKPELDSSPPMQDFVLGTLATDIANRDLVLSLAPARAPGTEPRPWEAPLLLAMVNAGQVPQAKTLWLRWTGIEAPSALIVNPDFRPLKAPPPFNWEVMAGPAGLAEVAADGGLSIVHYGRETMLLARQLVAAPTGAYRLATRGETGGDLSILAWTVRCSSGKVIATVPLGRGGQSDAPILVPGDCPAQWLELHARVPEVETTSEGNIRSVRLEPAS